MNIYATIHVLYNTYTYDHTHAHRHFCIEIYEYDDMLCYIIDIKLLSSQHLVEDFTFIANNTADLANRAPIKWTVQVFFQDWETFEKALLSLAGENQKNKICTQSD